MRDALKQLLRAPQSGARLETVDLSPASSGGDRDLQDGLLLDRGTSRAYPIVQGVPIMLEDAFTTDFAARHREALSRDPRLSGLVPVVSRAARWSFSDEWDQHWDGNTERTWGYTVQERVEQLMLETLTDRDWFRSRVVLDAGCGNGLLTQAIGELGGLAVGLDYSSSVLAAEQRRTTANVHFVQGDLQRPPFAAETFDLVFSIGVLHHTPNTASTFRAIAPLVKPGGRCYVWLYRRAERFAGRHLKAPLYAALRSVVSRLSPRPQRRAVTAYARLVRSAHHRMGRDTSIPLSEYVVAAYDDLTPTWRHSHTPFEVCRWFHEAGFSAPTLTHWDNPYGFGLVAVRDRQSSTPGMHYGSGAKLWDDKTTLLGQLDSD